VLRPFSPHLALLAALGGAACRRAPTPTLRTSSADAASGNDAALDAGTARNAHAVRDAGADTGTDACTDSAAPDTGTRGTRGTRAPRIPETLRTIVPKPGKTLAGSDLSIVCNGRKHCQIDSSQPAGRNAEGQDMTVLTISLGDNGPVANAREHEKCDAFEYWLVIRDAKGAQRADLLHKACNSDYGAGDEQKIETGPNRLIYTDTGGTLSHWEFTLLEQLSPRRVLDERNWIGGPGHDFADHWSWEDFAGWHSWYTSPCPADEIGLDPCEDNLPRNDAPISSTGYACYDIPVVSLEPAFTENGWRTTALGRCAVSVDGTAGHGFVIHGTHGGPTDSVMRVVGSPAGAFYVEIADDKIVGPSKQWIYDDHVEIWVGHSDPFDRNKAKENLRQWGVRISDGKVFAGSGSPDLADVKVELARGMASTHLKIVPPNVPEGTSFVYSDGDDGQSQHALLATSHLVFGNVLSLGQARAIAKADAVCRVKNGKLEPVLK
jgi:hypothetical protein